MNRDSLLQTEIVPAFLYMCIDRTHSILDHLCLCSLPSVLSHFAFSCSYFKTPFSMSSQDCNLLDSSTGTGIPTYCLELQLCV